MLITLELLLHEQINFVNPCNVAGLFTPATVRVAISRIAEEVKNLQSRMTRLFNLKEKNARMKLKIKSCMPFNFLLKR